MPAISKIRFTNVIYENGGKRYNDDIFQFDGYNGAILLENGGGKTVFVQTALQAILPHHDLEERKIRETLSLEGTPCHIAIEWILNERPRKYLVTAVTLFLTNNKLDSHRYVYEYGFDDEHNIDNLPFVKENQGGNKRPASKGEINDYYQYMQSRSMNAKFFKTIRDYQEYIEENYKIIPSEWKSIARINSAEGGVENYFENCKTTSQLVDRLLIPVVEEAISENGTKDFIKTFEEQRERFKKHRQLRDRIEESKQIEEKINEYVNVFNNYHNVNEDFINKKRYSKALYIHINKEKTNIEEEISKNQGDKEEIQNLYKELKRKEISYELAVLKEELDVYEEELKEAKKLFTQTKYDYDTKYTSLNNLNVAKLKQKIKETEEKIKNHQEHLNILESNIDIEEIKDKLEENSSKLKGYFINEEEELNKQKGIFQNQERVVKEEYEKEKNKLVELELLKQNILKDINKKKGQNIEIEKDLKRIKDRIVGLSEHEDIKKQQQRWRTRVGDLEGSIVENSKIIKQLENEKLTIDNELTLNRNNLSDLGKQQVSIKNKIDTANDVHINLLLQVKELNDRWYYIDSLYTRQDSIVNHIINKVENLINEKESLLLEERITGRFKDDYENSSYFAPEPLLEKWIGSWKNQFKYIETGTQYIQRAAKALGMDERELLNIYPYWPISVVVDDVEIETLKDKLTKDIDKMTSPILILGESDAGRLVKEGKNVEELLILPKYWRENINQEFFENWKVEINKKVYEVTQKRKLKEDEIARYNQSLKDLGDFFNQFPYEYYKKLKEDENSIEESYYFVENLIKNKENRLNVIHSEISRRNQQIGDNKEEVNNLNQWIQLAQDYIVKDKEKENVISLIYQLGDKYKKLDFEIKVIENEITRKTSILKDLNYDIEQFINRINSLLDSDLYKEVKEAHPIFTNINKTSLEEERKNLQDILYEKQGDVKKYYEFIKMEEDRKKELIKGLNRARKQSDYPIDEGAIFPSYGEDEIEKLIEDIEGIKPIKKELEDNLKEKEKKYNDQFVKYKVSKEQFYKEYDEIVIFNQSLYNIKIFIEKEREELSIRQKRNKEMHERFLNEKEDIDKGVNSLEIENGKYEYLAESIELIDLEEDFYRDFPYKRREFINNTLGKLEELNAKLKEVSFKLESEKNKFIIYCNDKIKDPRLKERTISGVNQKTNYNEILEWQSRMKASIETTIRIAEDDIRQHDKDLEQFITHLTTYLRTLTDELNIIPKKTRIKIDDRWKEVYQFNIPEWKEEEGKEELRKHVDWMIKELEHNEFKNEDGTDNTANIRKEIEKWLDSKQLLPIVLKNNQIKVSCRKVTNDGKISGGLTTWESSNRWSGGEKWSKNMTLFLGILNYVAEKRQGIITGLKSNRTVIVDNPFGKASSDHVLDPVFLIAEKLGFQIIALTAHTEGSFIRNYFPVVYSCRLREATNNNSLIIDKEKEIQYAFFRDKDPETLNRLEEKKQLTLFG